MTQTLRTSRSIMMAGLLLVATGCTYVPFDAPRTEPAAATSLAAVPVDRIVAGQGGRSGIFPLVDGNDALGARLSMIDEAQRSVDLQSFLIKPDKAGSLVSLALLRAADRGVSVRLLFDDVFTKANDAQLALLDAHPNISVRLFNPLSRRSPTAMNYLLDFDRVNRRMHNKAFVVDRSMAIVGGRNVADEYYQIGTDSEFADLDLFVAGPVVGEIADAFDLFWQDSLAVPVDALRGTASTEPTDAVQRLIEAEAQQARDGIYSKAVGSRYLADVRAGRVAPLMADATVVTDTPDKLRVPVPEGERALAETLVQNLARAQREVVILTPYFVPEDWGARLFASLAERGVRVRVVTNSLAANNHAYVHGGYMRHRKALLAAGVDLYEVRADAPQLLGDVPGDAHASLTMHTKLAVIDDVTVVGSLNFDPRSIKLNTEIGLFIEDAAIARNLVREIDADIRKYAFRLSLDAQGDLIWTWAYDGRMQVYRQEPGATAWQKAQAAIAAALPVEGQL